MRCECNLNSMNNPIPKSKYSKEEFIGMKHLPNECECTNQLKLYRRRSDNMIRTLCSCCNIPFDDIEIKEKK